MLKSKFMIQILKLAILLTLAGCSLSSPKVPQVIEEHPDAGAYSLEDFKQDRANYVKKFDKKDLDAARRVRDRIINNVMIDIENNYRKFEGAFFMNRAQLNVGADLVELSLALAATVTGGASAKTVLASVLSAAKGTRLSIDQNFFRERTSEMIISQMQASRGEIRNRIRKQMLTLPVDQYPFEMAQSDLIEFFYAGTIHSAMLGLANMAGESAEAARIEATEIAELLIPTAQEVKQIISVRQKFNELFKDKENNVDKVKDALGKLGVSIPAGASTNDIFVLLNNEIRKTKDDRSHLPKVIEALGLQ